MATDNPFNIFIPGDRHHLPATGDGALSDLTFVAKDNFDLKGRVTRNGCHLWAEGHDAATMTAPLIDRLRDQGAALDGIVVMDALAYGSLGDVSDDPNPLNVKNPDRYPGGSSSGSGAAVAAGLCDFALGTDTGCSVRMPAACQGLWGMRPTLGALPLDGVTPLSPSLDCIGWFGRDHAMLARVGDVILPQKPATEISQLLIWPAIMDWIDPAIRPAIDKAMAALPLPLHEIDLIDEDPGWFWYHCWRQVVLEAEALFHGWAEEVGLTGPLAEQTAASAAMTDADKQEITDQFASLRTKIRSALRPGQALVFPTLTGPPPPLDDRDALDLNRTFCLMSIAGLGGLPQLVMPVSRPEGLPLSLSLIGAVDQDRALVSLAGQFSG